MKQMTTHKLLEKLVSFKPVTSMDNAPIASFIKGFLENCGMSVVLVPKGGNNSIVATMGADDKPAFIFSGHIDVVPPDEYSKHSGWWCHNHDVKDTPEPSLSWTKEPHVCHEQDGRIYGRGTCDMLGAIASLLTLAQTMRAEDLKYKIIYSFTCDEETEMASVHEIIEQNFPDRTAANFPVGCIVMEPTGMEPVIAHRGVVAGKVYVDGKVSHVSRPDIMVDPIEPLLDVLRHFKKAASEYVAHETTDPYFIPSKSNYTIYTMRTHENGRDTPHMAEFGYVFHYMPENYPTNILRDMDDYVAAIDARLKDIDPSCGVRHVVDFKLAPFSLGQDNALLSNVFSASNTNSFSKVGFFTEAGPFSQAGIPAIIIGPGSILQAHVPDEYVEVSQLDKADKFLKNMYMNFLIR